MKTFSLILAAVTLALNLAFSQGTSINTTGAKADSSAILDVSSTLKGALIPRMSIVQQNAIISPAEGLIIYNTDCKTFNFYNGVSWISIGNVGTITTPGSITGNTSLCANAPGEIYFISPVSGATSYNWTAPQGATIVSGQGSDSITVNFGSISGNICVAAVNQCGVSNAACLAVSIQNPPQPVVANAASNIMADRLTANWNSATGAAFYSLDVSTDNNFSSFVGIYNNLNVGAVLTYDVTNLTCNTTYYYRVRAENTCGAGADSDTVTAVTSACFSCGGVLTDIDGNNYNTVLTGSQCWMKENLRTTKYNDNSSIPNETNDAAWAALSTGAWCYYQNNSTYNIPYGKMYNWFAVNNTGSLCPTGWHVPTDAEVCTLENTVEPGTDPGCNTTGWRGSGTGTKLKSTSTDWSPPGTDNFGFNAYPGGYRNSGDGSFNDFYDLGRWWTSSEYDANNAYFRTLRRDYTSVQRGAPDKTYGFFVRCIKN